MVSELDLVTAVDGRRSGADLTAAGADARLIRQ
jgi:hypothetical protein